jgi:hypothetical protein
MKAVPSKLARQRTTDATTLARILGSPNIWSKSCRGAEKLVLSSPGSVKTKMLNFPV